MPGNHRVQNAVAWAWALALVLVPTVSAQPLERIGDVRLLAPAQATQSRPVNLRGTITALSGWKNSYFLHDGTGDISVDRNESVVVEAGDEVEVTGVSAAGQFANIVIASQTVVTGKSSWPVAKSVTHRDLAEGTLDSQWVEVRGIVHSATVVESWGRQVLLLDLKMESSTVTVRVHTFAGFDYHSLEDAEVRIQGVAGANFNDRRQFRGVRLFVPAPQFVVVETKAADPRSLPLQRLEELLRSSSAVNLGHRVRVSATVTHQNLDLGMLYVQSGGDGAVVHGTGPAKFPPGTNIEIAGFMVPNQYTMTFEEAIVWKVGDSSLPERVTIRAADVIHHKDDFAFAPTSGLRVRLEGDFIKRVAHGEHVDWLVRDGSQLFAAHVERGLSDSLATITTGSRLRLTGICETEVDRLGDPVGFSLLLSSRHDLEVIHAGSWSWRVVTAILLAIGLVLPVWTWKINRMFRSRGLSPRPNVLDSPPLRFLETIGHLAGVLAFALGALALVGGWWLGAEAYQFIRPDTTLGLMAAGAALTCLRRPQRTFQILVDVGSVGTAALGALTVFEHVAGIDLGIDRLILGKLDLEAMLALRMPTSVAATLTLIGISLFLAARPRYIRTAQMLACVAATLSMVNLTGYLLGARRFPGLLSPLGMALPAAVGFTMLALGVLCLSWQRGWMALISGPGPGGLIARRLLPAVVAAPISLAWMCWIAQVFGWFDAATGLTLFACSNVVVFTVLIWANAGLLNRLDEARSEAEGQLNQLNHQLEERVASRTADLGEANRDLVSMRAQLQSVLDAATHVSIVATDETGVIRLFNRGAEKMLGYSAEEMVGKWTPGRFHDPAEFRERSIDVSPEGLTTSFVALDGSADRREWTYIHKDGHRIDVLLEVTRIVDQEGQLTGFLGVAKDITAAVANLKALESELRLNNQQLLLEKHKAEQANRTKSDFLASVSHEIRTPMNAIMGMSELLARTTLTEEQRRYLDVFQRACSSLLTLINDILDVSKIESEKFELERVEFDLRDLATCLIDLLEPKARSKALELRCQIDPGVPESVAGDPARTRQVLINLLGNAIKFTEQGEVSLAISSQAELGGRVTLRFAVSDTGIGIPANRLDCIFDDFTQAEVSIGYKYGGTGLGLAISRRIANQMGGALTVASEMGHGSTFHFVVTFDRVATTATPALSEHLQVLDSALRRADPAPPADVPAPAPMTNRETTPMKILVADDSADNRMLIEAYLQDTPYELVFVVDGRAAVDQATSTTAFDLILMDIRMPTMDGHKATRAIRAWEASCQHKPVPILAISANAMPADLEQSQLAGCNGHLSKPISRQSLIDAIERWGCAAPLTPPPETSNAINGIIRVSINPMLGKHVESYLLTRRKDADEMPAILDRADFERIGRLGHNMKGTGTPYGLPELTRLGHEMERAAGQRDTGTLSGIIAELKEYLGRVELVPS